jgi:hypothetical protein
MCEFHLWMIMDEMEIECRTFEEGNASRGMMMAGI